MPPRPRIDEIPQRTIHDHPAGGRHLLDHDYGNRSVPQARLQVPFGLEISDFPHIQALLEADPTLVEQANIMMRPNLSKKSIKSYSGTIRDFKDMCVRESLPFPSFDEQSIIRFLATSHKNDAPFSFYRKVIPALRALEGILGVKTSALTERVIIAKNSLMRVVAAKRKSVRKAHAFSVEVLNELIRKVVLPHQDSPWKINASDFRGIVRASVYYYCFCRYSDYEILTDKDVQDCGDHLKIFFKRSKNDQFYQGSMCVIAAQDSATCPVKLIRLYFQRFGLVFASDRSTGTYLNFRLQKTAGSWKALPGSRLSQSAATDRMRATLAKVTPDAHKFTEKSFKVSGVTALLDAGESLENVMLAGRWRGLLTPQHYRNTSIQFRLSIARRIPCA